MSVRPILLPAILALLACTAASEPQPQKPTPASATETALYGLGASDAGTRLFGDKCGFCHVGRSTGAMMIGRRLGAENAQLLERTDLDGDYVKAVVRNGLGNMPAFTRVDVTDAELDLIAAFLTRDKTGDKTGDTPQDKPQ